MKFLLLIFKRVELLVEDYLMNRKILRSESKSKGALLPSGHKINLFYCHKLQVQMSKNDINFIN